MIVVSDLVETASAGAAAPGGARSRDAARGAGRGAVAQLRRSSCCELLSGFEPEGVHASAAPKRRAEFLAGRHAAKLALERLGQRAPVGRNLDGTPAWPSGVTGSISHGGGIACAAVAPQRNYQSLGIDVERILLDRDGPEVAPTVARPDELLLLRTAPAPTCGSANG